MTVPEAVLQQVQKPAPIPTNTHDCQVPVSRLRSHRQRLPATLDQNYGSEGCRFESCRARQTFDQGDYKAAYFCGFESPWDTPDLKLDLECPTTKVCLPARSAAVGQRFTSVLPRQDCYRTWRQPTRVTPSAFPWTSTTYRPSGESAPTLHSALLDRTLRASALSVLSRSMPAAAACSPNRSARSLGSRSWESPASILVCAIQSRQDD